MCELNFKIIVLFMFIVGQMYSLDPGVEPQTYAYNVPEEIRRFIHFFHQHVTEQVCTRQDKTKTRQLYYIFAHNMTDLAPQVHVAVNVQIMLIHQPLLR